MAVVFVTRVSGISSESFLLTKPMHILLYK